MKLYVPSIGDSIILTKDWSFSLEDEYRNDTLYDFLTGKPRARDWTRWQSRPGGAINGNLPAGTVLTVDRIYIKKGRADYNSITFMVKKTPFYKKGKLRFWVKLKDANEIEFEPYIP